MRKRQLGYAFRRQHPIGPYFADYCYTELRLAIEVDGDWHNEGHDARRDTFFLSKHIRTHRIPIAAIDESIQAVMDVISYVIRERELELGGLSASS